MAIRHSTLIILTLLLVFKGAILHAQTMEQRSLFLLKENHEVDSIVRIVIKDSHTKDICFSLTTNNDIGYYFSILRLAKGKDETYYCVTQPRDIKPFGYFIIDGYKVFVYGDDEPLLFFKKTQTRTTFNFIKLSDVVDWSDNSSTYLADPEHRNGKYVFGTSDIHDKAFIKTGVVLLVAPIPGQPFGILSISVKKAIAPNDRPFDGAFQKTVNTDNDSFNLIVNYIKESKYLHPLLKKTGSSSKVYEIIIASDSVKEDLFLAESDFSSFFEPLKLLLKNKCTDTVLIDAFKYY